MFGAGRETISGLCGPLAARCVLIRQLPPELIRSLTGSSKTRKQAGAWLRYSRTWHPPHAGFLNSCRFQNSATGWKKSRYNPPTHPPKQKPLQPTRLQHPFIPGAGGAAPAPRCRMGCGAWKFSTRHVPCGAAGGSQDTPGGLFYSLGKTSREGVRGGGVPADFPSTVSRAASPPPSPPSLACP